jgi:hypothetical protein
MTPLTHLLDDEVLIIEDGGEMPEVTMHSCLHFLTRDPDGPQATLAAPELLRLKQAVIRGYQRIIRRDLTPENRGKGHYRGLARSAVNWQRLLRFCCREGLDPSPVAEEVRELLGRFLLLEFAEVERAGKGCCINCSGAELVAFCHEVGFDPSGLPEGWQGLLCRGGS